MVGFQDLEFCNLHIQVHLLFDKRVSDAQCLDLRIGQRLFIHIVAGAHRGFAGHNLADKPLLVLKGLEQIRIERTLCDVVEHIDFLIHVALSDDTTVALGHVAGFPADIQMMHCYKTLLDIGSCAHFCGAAQQDAHIAGAHFREQCCLFRFGVGVVDELNFVFWHTGGNQLLANIIVDIEIAIVFGCREVAEQKLRQLLVFTFLPDLQDVPHTDVQLAVRVIREHRVHQADIQTDFSAIVGDAQHIVHGRIHIAGVNLGGTSAQFLHQLLDDDWKKIAIDLEIIQTEGFAATKQVDPNMVLKKDAEVQDGWVGHVLPFELVQSVKMHEEVAALRAKETRLSEIAGEYESYLDELSEEDKEQNFVNDAKDAFVAAEVKKAIKAREVEPATMRILKDVDALFAEEKTLKKQVKDDSAALHQRTKGVIEGLTDEEVRDLLHRKWILPLMENLNSLPDAVLDDFVKQLDAVCKKYETTFEDVESQIASTEHELLGLLDDLQGNEFDMQGIAELKKLLGGE